MRRSAAVLGMAATAMAGAMVLTAAPAAPSKTTSTGTALRLTPKARVMSTYTLECRFEVFTKNVTFDVPQAYQDSFAFWTGRMTQNKRMEVIEIVTSTSESNQNGSVPFKRTVPKFNLELEKKGQPLTPYGPLEKQVTSLAWAGSLDRFGNVKEIRKVAGPDNPEVDGVAFPQFDAVFPELQGPREIRVGEAFTETRVLPLPTRVNVLGLEQTTVRLTREYILKETSGSQATFEVKVTYANDSGNPPKAPDTTCLIAGGGTGQAVFDTRRGVFLSANLPSAMTIDIEAPLRPLPDKPETAHPGKGKTHIDLELLVAGLQTVQRTWGEDQD